MRDLSRSSGLSPTLFVQLKQEYEDLQGAKQDKKARQEATKKKALADLKEVVKPILDGYKLVRAIDKKAYEARAFPKPDRWSLGYETDENGWVSIVNVSPQFDGDGNIEHLYVSLGKSINSPEPWATCELSTKELVSTIEELHRKQHS